MHVYFDANDEPKRVTFGGKVQPLTNEFSDILIHFAIEKSDSVIQALRKQHNNTLVRLEAAYCDIEKKLTSQSFNLASSERTAYIELHRQALDVLKSLAAYHYDQHYENLLLLYKNVAKSFATDCFEHQGKRLESSNPKLTTEEVIVSAESASSIMPIVAKASLSSQIQEINHSKNNLTSVSEILATYTRVVDLFTMAESDRYDVTYEDFQQIQLLTSEIISKAKDFLLMLLMNQKIQEAETLHAFVNPVSKKWIKLAVQTANAPMLDFLLKHNSCPIKTFVMDNDLSLVEFCFDKGSTHVECLSVLIKYKASILYPAADGLPIGHHILSDFSHPLRKALIDNTETTIGQPRFYYALIRHLELYLQDNIGDELRAKLLASIINYRQSILSLEENRSSVSQYQLRQVNQSFYNLSSLPSIKSVVTELNDEPLWHTLRIELEEVSAEFNKKIPKDLRRQLDQANLAIGKKLEDSELATQLSKEACFTYLKDKIRVTRLACELFDVREILVKFNQSVIGRKRTPKHIKQCAIREKEILGQIGEFQRKYFQASKQTAAVSISSTQKNNILSASSQQSLSQAVSSNLKTSGTLFSRPISDAGNESMQMPVDVSAHRVERAELAAPEIPDQFKQAATEKLENNVVHESTTLAPTVAPVTDSILHNEALNPYADEIEKLRRYISMRSEEKEYHSFWGKIGGFSATLKIKSAQKLLLKMQHPKDNIKFSDDEIRALNQGRLKDITCSFKKVSGIKIEATKKSENKLIITNNFGRLLL